MRHARIQDLITHDAHGRPIPTDRDELTAALAAARAATPLTHTAARWSAVALLALATPRPYGKPHGPTPHGPDGGLPAAHDHGDSVQAAHNDTRTPVDPAAPHETAALCGSAAYDEARDLLDRALALAPAPADLVATRLDLATLHHLRGDLYAATTLLTRTLPLARDHAPALEQTALNHLATLTSADFRQTLPPAIAALLGPSPTWSDDHEGLSGSVSRVKATTGTFWIKHGPAATAEHTRLTWLTARGLPTPEIAAYEPNDPALTPALLVLADAASPSLATASLSGAEIGARLGRTLRALHTLPPCPFDGSLDVMLDESRRQVLEDLVDADDFDPDNEGQTPGQVLTRLLTTRPPAEDLVVTHGDFTPSNVLLNGTILDVSRLGMADRHRDLALAARDLTEDFGPAAVTAFFTAYCLATPDPALLEYYRLLDELF
ncbi:phosphotransferase [Nonomuraea sp. NPDC050328]|uniref:phosphotransferase n=1 Tax=Nonomuraea sp. NPDC050328 TaxID=3364361 RepID=UPI0037961170